MRLADSLRTSILVIAVSALALTGCAENPGSGTGTGTDAASTDIRGEWRFDGGTQGSESIAIDDFPVTMVFSNGSARVRTGCFSFDQPMTADLAVVTASYVSPPQASCMALSADAQSAIDSLGGVTSAERNGDLLNLVGDDLSLEFTLVPAAEPDAVVGEWSLGTVMLGDAGLTPQGDGPALVFGEDGTISGSTGCAEFTGTYEIVSGLNVVENLDYVEGMCTAEEVQTMVDTNIREVLDHGFLVHAGDGIVSLVSSTSDTTLIYSPKA
jgi:heat shock protein HslJ